MASLKEEVEMASMSYIQKVQELLTADEEARKIRFKVFKE